MLEAIQAFLIFFFGWTWAVPAGCRGRSHPQKRRPCSPVPKYTDTPPCTATNTHNITGHFTTYHPRSSCSSHSDYSSKVSRVPLLIYYYSSCCCFYDSCHHDNLWNNDHFWYLCLCFHHYHVHPCELSLWCKALPKGMKAQAAVSNHSIHAKCVCVRACMPVHIRQMCVPMHIPGKVSCSNLYTKAELWTARCKTLCPTEKHRTHREA